MSGDLRFVHSRGAPFPVIFSKQGKSSPIALTKRQPYALIVF
jgi:hypothetical protein